MQKIKAEHGAEAVAFGRGTGINNTHIVSRLANLFGTPNITAIAYFCYGPRVAVSKVTASGEFLPARLGHDADPRFFGQPNCIVQWGSQKRTSNDHGLIGHTPLTDALNRKPMNIVVDPRKPKPAGPVDLWLPLRPATDAAMALGWMNVIINEELYDKEFVENYCHGFEELRRRVQDYPLAKVADITWCDRRDDCARRAHLCDHAPGMHRLGQWYRSTRQQHLPGDAFAPHSDGADRQPRRARAEMFSIPPPSSISSSLWDKLPPEQEKKRLGGDRFKALNLTPYAYAHPPSLYHTILTEKPYPVKAYIVVGNNTVTCFPNTKRIIEAMKKLDLLVVQDIFMTPTAEYADIVLPAAGNLERDEPRFHLLTKGPQATYVDTVSQKLAELGERRSDWEFIIALGRKLGFEEYFPALEDFANEGLKRLGISWDDLKKKPHGVEFPVEYHKYKTMGFGTPTGKFEIYSTMMENWGYDPLPAHVEPPESPISTPDRWKDYPLILNTGAKQPMFWHSQGRQLKTLRSLNTEPLAEMHSATAAKLGIKKDDYIWIETVRGKLRMKVLLNEATHEKVVTIPHGWWLPEAPGPDHGVFEVCSNVLVDDTIENCDVVLGSSPLKAMLCRISKAPAPERTVTERWKESQLSSVAAE